MGTKKEQVDMAGLRTEDRERSLVVLFFFFYLPLESAFPTSPNGLSIFIFPSLSPSPPLIPFTFMDLGVSLSVL